MAYESKISVRGLVEFVYQSGDLDSRFQGKGKMAEGIRTHQKIQKSQGDGYIAEVPLSKSISLTPDDGDDPITLIISGRADGILTTSEGVTVDEIKGTSVFLEKIEEDTYPVHWAQAKIYGAIYSENESLSEITIQLTYADFESGAVKRIKRLYSSADLNEFMMETVKRYKKWIVFKSKWVSSRNQSIEKLTFPFGSYRAGQRALAVSVYNAIRDGEHLFAQAPTGIGKTMSTLFPTIKSMGSLMTDKIFYLSAKTIAKGVAEDAVKQMRTTSEGNLHIKQLTITARDKVCINDVVACYPEKCPFANGHYDRNLDALWDALNNEDVFSRESVVSYAQKHRVCPYEFSLDLALFSDVIICDYNYVFDPRVYLRRFFDVPTEEYVFLVDEAHNLVDRSRTMYSAELSRDNFTSLKKKLIPKDKKLGNSLEGINKLLLNARKNCNEAGIWVSSEGIEEVAMGLKKRAPQIEKWLTENAGAEYFEQVLEVYFDILGYLRISELYDDGYLTYITGGHKKEMLYKLFCIHPATKLRRFLMNSRSAIFFSATLSPMPYYRDLLCKDEDIKLLDLPSPFDPDNRLLLYASDVSVKYKDRDNSLSKICGYIYEMASAKTGNYMVFFPSYQYMDNAFMLFEALHGERFNLVRQTRDLSDSDKVDFLGAFETHLTGASGTSMISFVVMGGHFSEGIDLQGDLLIGAMVVGVGLPMIAFENNLIKDYFDDISGHGFEFAYQFPGINKVMQSAGRVIRGSDDRGVVILVDQRYSTGHYRRFFPKDWGKIFTSEELIKGQLETFWKNI